VGGVIPAQKVYSFSKKRDPQNYKFINQKGTADNRIQLIKAPGEVDGQQFIIEGCENCDIYIMDHTAQVSIDQCKGCTIFIGPCDGSVFLRESSNCTVGIICQQFRTRDCRDIDIYLHIKTQPSIESSMNMRFSCLSVAYPQLLDQFKKTSLSPYHNIWYQIYDFTSNPSNWTISKDLATVLKDAKDISFDRNSSLLPYTCGSLNPSAKSATVFFLLPLASKDEAVVDYLNQAKQLEIRRTIRK